MASVISTKDKGQVMSAFMASMTRVGTLTLSQLLEGLKCES
jgi:hypothetical protein